MPTLVPIRLGSSPEGTRLRPLIRGVAESPPPLVCAGNTIILQAPFDGTNGSTTIPDVSTYAHGNANIVGAAHLDTAIKLPWSTASLDTTGGGNVNWNASGGIGPWWVLGDTWTIEIFAMWAVPAAQDQGVIGQFEGIGFGGGNFMLFTGTAGLAGRLRFFIYDGVGFPVDLVFPGTVPGPGAGFQYYCMESNGTKVRVYTGPVGGNAAMVDSVTPAPGSTGCGSSTSDLGVGAGNAGGGRHFSGHIGPLRITRGCAQYDTDGTYPVPSAAFPIPT